MDLNKNRQHKTVDTWIRDTYIAQSRSLGRTTRKLLFDPYVKAIRWASNRIGDEGIVCLVSNNSFVEELAFDGMRKCLAEEFDSIYCLDLGGNIRKNPKLSGTTHNVFGIQIGIVISAFIRHRNRSTNGCSIYFARVGEDWRKEEKYKYLEEVGSWDNVNWRLLTPNRNHVWLTEGLDPDSGKLISIGSKATKALSRLSADQARTIFHLYALGVSTNKDSWLYNAREYDLERNVIAFSEVFNAELDRWKRAGRPKNVLAFVTNDVKKIKWSSLLVDKFKRERYAVFDAAKLRVALYRPFTKRVLYFDKLLIDAPTLQEQFFPTPTQEKENISIYVSDKGLRSPFSVLAVNSIADLHLCASTDGFQSFPFYTYDEDGGHRRENITDWALEQFRAHYRDRSITKWEIFYYVYALLHHVIYRERYAINLKHELPRIPYAPDFKVFAKIGESLAELHVNYEQQHEYALEAVETPRIPLDWRVAKMKLSKDKRSLIYNEFLTLSGIPAEVFEYRLGNRSALDWIIDQYQVHMDKRSGIINDPNRVDDPQYIVRLIGQVITVSLETVELVRRLNDHALTEAKT